MKPYEEFLFYYWVTCTCILCWGLYALLTGVRLAEINSVLEAIAGILFSVVLSLTVYAVYLCASDWMQSRKAKEQP